MATKKKSTAKPAAEKIDASVSKPVADTAAEKAGAEELTSPLEHAAVTEDVPALVDVAAESVPDDVEIAARSADMDKPSTTHEKQFVLGPHPIFKDSNPYTAERGYDHEPNKAGVRQYMIDQGMWPTEDVKHVSTKKHPDGESWILTYSVEAIPAHEARDGSQTPHVVDDDGDATNAINYLPPERVAEHETVAPHDA